MYEFPKEYRPYKPFMENETFPFIIGTIVVSVFAFWMYRNHYRFATGKS